jgi:hypothetical protein
MCSAGGGSRSTWTRSGSGVSSTDEEHQAAIVRAAEIAAYRGRERGWPTPILADSGNGAHLLYRIDLVNDDESLSIRHTPLLCDFWPHGVVAQKYELFREENSFSERANVIINKIRLLCL